MSYNSKPFYDIFRKHSLYTIEDRIEEEDRKRNYNKQVQFSYIYITTRSTKLYTIQLLHQRLRHLSYNTLKHIKKATYSTIIYRPRQYNPDYETYHITKIHRILSRSQPRTRSQEPFSRVHFDLVPIR